MTTETENLCYILIGKKSNGEYYHMVIDNSTNKFQILDETKIVTLKNAKEESEKLGFKPTHQMNFGKTLEPFLF